MPQFTNNLEESLQKARQELAVLENLRKQTLAAPTQPRLLEELNNTIKSLTPEEREGLQRNSAYAEASKLYEDGFNMNIVRNHIIYDKRKCQEELEEKDYPKEYFRETPPQVDNYYMARMDEIRENAKSSLLVYKADENYIFIMQNLGKLNERQKEQCHLDAVMGYITGLQSFINGNDYVGMRRHERPERYQDSFKYCRKQIEEYLKEIPKEKVLPTGQLTLFDLFDMSGG